MTIIKGTTKKGENMINNASNFCGVNLYDIYNSYSSAKYRAWEWCKNKCIEECGNNFHIISFNTFNFSVAWLVKNGVRIETANNSYLVLYPEYC